MKWIKRIRTSSFRMFRSTRRGRKSIWWKIL